MKLTTQQQVEMTIEKLQKRIDRVFVESVKMKPVKPDASIIRNPMAWSPQNALWFRVVHGDEYDPARVDLSMSGKIQLNFSDSFHDEFFLNGGKNHNRYVTQTLKALEEQGFHTYGGIKPTQMDLNGLFGISWSKANKPAEELSIVHRIASRQIFGATYFNGAKSRCSVEASGYAMPIRNNEYTSLR